MTLRTAVRIAVTTSIVTTVGFGAVPAGRIAAAADASAANPAMRDAAAGTPVQLKTADGLTLGALCTAGAIRA